MNLSQQIAKQFREVYFGGNWTAVNLKESLSDVNWQQATSKIYNLNTIAILVAHTNYYIGAVTRVLEGGILDTHDKFSFDHPPIMSSQDWESLLKETWAGVEILASLIEQLPESKLWLPFTDEKYGNYYSNLHGVIEHTHYHLGQIVIIKKILPQTTLINNKT